MQTNTLQRPIVNDVSATMARLPVFIEKINEMIAANFAQQAAAFLGDWERRGLPVVRGGYQRKPPSVHIGTGRKYIRGMRCDGSVYGFVRTADGAILMNANGRQPALNHVRGFIFDDDVTKACGPGGVKYMT